MTGPVLHLVPELEKIPLHVRARRRIYAFTSPCQLAFIAAQAELVRTPSDKVIEGASFRRYDAEVEFAQLVAATKPDAPQIS